MELFDIFKQANINEGLQEYRNTRGAVLLDVRTPDEYRQGHVPGSKSVPVQQLDKVNSIVKYKNIPLFVYCYSGSRSRQAVSVLQRMGYKDVRNIGGIVSYRGKVER